MKWLIALICDIAIGCKHASRCTAASHHVHRIPTNFRRACFGNPPTHCRCSRPTGCNPARPFCQCACFGIPPPHTATSHARPATAPRVILSAHVRHSAATHVLPYTAARVAAKMQFLHQKHPPSVEVAAIIPQIPLTRQTNWHFRVCLLYFRSKMRDKQPLSAILLYFCSSEGGMQQLEQHSTRFPFRLA